MGREQLRDLQGADGHKVRDMNSDNDETTISFLLVCIAMLLVYIAILELR